MRGRGRVFVQFGGALAPQSLYSIPLPYGLLVTAATVLAPPGQLCPPKNQDAAEADSERERVRETERRGGGIEKDRQTDRQTDREGEREREG